MEETERAQLNRAANVSSPALRPSLNPNPRPSRLTAQDFLQEQEIRTKLAEAMINQDRIEGGFITHNSVELIWTKDILKRFLEKLGFKNDDTLVGLVMKHLLKTISILVAIAWGDWHLFGTKFLEYDHGGGPGRTPRQDRNDSTIPYSFETLEDNAFLGPGCANYFLVTQYPYIPIVLKEGETAIFPRTRPLPFIRSKSKTIAEGGYGVVTKEVIACGQFRYLHDPGSNDLNTVSVSSVN